MSTAREEILSKIKQALATPSEPMAEPNWDLPIYARPAGITAVQEFEENFKSRKGFIQKVGSAAEAVGAINEYLTARGIGQVKVWEPAVAQLLEGAPFTFDTTEANLHDVEASITHCECIVARTGSFITTSRQATGRRLTIYPPTHIVIAYTHQLVDDIKDALALMQTRYGDGWPSMVGLVTGASRTADIEKTLVLGAHGPKELALFLIEQ